jgi:predicted dehydrogenase
MNEYRPLRVGVIGFGWMGRLHARAWARLAAHYPDLPLRPVLVAVGDSNPSPDLARSVGAHGFTELHADWRDLLARDDLDVVSVCGPNFLHRDMGIAVAESGRHLWIEKPAGRDAEETAEIVAAVEKAGVQSAAGFNYRNAPAVEHARQLVLDGALGNLQTVEVRFLADYAAHPQGALSWRFLNEQAGSGVSGDLASHAADLARYVAGEVVELVADDGRFITGRPLAAGAGSHFARGVEGTLGDVENEDYIGALLRFDSGARGTLVAGRTAVGEQCGYEIAVHGDRGALAWDFRRMGELRVSIGADYLDASYTTVLANPTHGEYGAFQPGGGIAMGYDDLKVIEAHRLARSIDAGEPVGATIQDALRAAVLVDAMQTSVSEHRWIKT